MRDSVALAHETPIWDVATCTLQLPATVLGAGAAGIEGAVDVFPHASGAVSAKIIHKRLCTDSVQQIPANAEAPTIAALDAWRPVATTSHQAVPVIDVPCSVLAPALEAAAQGVIVKPRQSY